jgi:hypothetical protein
MLSPAPENRSGQVPIEAGLRRGNEAWEAGNEGARVACCFRDLSHTGYTRGGGTPFFVVGAAMGWSSSTTVRTATSHGHIGQTAVHEAVKTL